MAQFSIRYPATMPRPQKMMPLLRRFWPWVRPHRKLLVSATVFMLASLPVSVVVPLLVRYLIDTVVAQGLMEQLLPTAAVLIGLTLLNQGLNYAQLAQSNRLHLLVVYGLRQALFSHLLKLPAQFFLANDTGTILGRQRDDLQNLNGVMADQLLRAGVNLLRFLVFAGLLFVLDPAMALTGLALAVVFFGANLLFSRPLRARTNAVQEAELRASRTLHENISGIRLVKMTGMRNRERRRYGRRVRSAIRAARRRDLFELWNSEFVGLAGTLGALAIVLVGAWRIMNGTSTFGNLFAFFLYLSNLFGAIGGLLRLNGLLQKALNALERIFDVLDTPAEAAVRTNSGAIALPRVMAFRDVSFAYQSGGEALTGIDVRWRAGEQVALVGPSGAGKSTFVQLLARFFDPTGGAILFDGRDIRTLDLEGYRRLIGFVPQDIFLFNRTVRENLVYGCADVSDARIEEAARAAEAWQFVSRLPDGLDTLVGERGVRLSGGERQRLALAREMLRDPAILILDEATSSLDSHAEAQIQGALQRLREGRTSVTIAHRLSTIVQADRILVFDEGRIVEEGSHQELLEAGGLYAYLHDRQFRHDAPAEMADVESGSN